MPLRLCGSMDPLLLCQMGLESCSLEMMEKLYQSLFKLDFLCSNNIVEYEAYLTGLAVACEMGIKHLKVVGDSNLIVYQARGEFSLKEPSLAPY